MSWVESKNYHRKNRVRLVEDGKDFKQSICQLIKSAEKQIQFFVYIFEDDQLGLELIEALIDASKRGVEVSLVVDYIGSYDLSYESIKRMKAAGILFSYFNPFKVYNFYHLGRRLHGKVFVIDGDRALLGGINIVNPYLEKYFKTPRLDFALEVEGETVHDIHRYCTQLNILQFDRQFHNLDLKRSYDETFNIPVKFCINDWVKGKQEITQSYSRAISHAKTELIIINGYFLPGHRVLNTIKSASRRGVKVKLILPGFSDWNSWKMATEYLYRYLQHENIEIYEWSGSILHAKLAIVDDDWCTVGSYNLNYTSYFGNLEMNLNVWDKKFVKSMKQLIDKNVTVKSVKLSREIIEGHHFFHPKNLLRLFYYFLIRLIAKMSKLFLLKKLTQ